MRHAFLILAYNEFWLLKKLVAFLSNPSCDIYLNIDKKTDISKSDLDALKSNVCIRRITRHTIHWGGRDMLNCEIEMLKFALLEKRADYFHLLSGQDYPIKPLSDFLVFFEKEKGKNFLYCKEGSFKKIWRQLFFFQPLDWYDARGKWGDKITLGICEIQMKLGLFRSVSRLPMNIYVGSQWFSLTKKACNFIVRYTTEHKSFYQRLKNTFVPDEIYINTILMNYFHEEEIVSTDNLRYIRWYEENGNNPSNLGMEHFAILASRHEFFTRKLTLKYGLELVKNIDTFLLDETDLGKDCRNFNEQIGKFLKEIFLILSIKSCLVVGNNQLYTNVLQGDGIDVNGLYSNLKATEFLQVAKLSDICQFVDFTEPVSINPDDRFEVLLLVNQYQGGQEYLLNILKSATNLVRRYVLIIEEKITPYKITTLEGMIGNLDFETNKELNTLLSASLSKSIDDILINFLIKK